MYEMCRHRHVMIYLELKLPWELLSAKLNRLLAEHGESAGVNNGDMPVLENGVDYPLPEDIALRGFEWTENYFPEKWFTTKKLNNFGKSLSERILFLGRYIANSGYGLSYDLISHKFSALVHIILDFVKVELNERIGWEDCYEDSVWMGWDDSQSQTTDGEFSDRWFLLSLWSQLFLKLLSLPCEPSVPTTYPKRSRWTCICRVWLDADIGDINRILLGISVYALAQLTLPPPPPPLAHFGWSGYWCIWRRIWLFEDSSKPFPSSQSYLFDSFQILSATPNNVTTLPKLRDISVTFPDKQRQPTLFSGQHCEVFPQAVMGEGLTLRIQLRSARRWRRRVWAGLETAAN